MFPRLSGSSQAPLIASSAPREGFGVGNINMSVVGSITKTSQHAPSSSCFHSPISAAGLTNLQTWENGTRLKINPSPPSKPPAEISPNSMPPPSTKPNPPPCRTNSTGSSSSMTYGSCPPSSSHSGSEEEEQQKQEQQQEQKNNVIDERKQKRMISNRESARRSRMRKQQHLDELRAQIVQLRAENNHILTKFNLTSQHYLQLKEQNRILRSQAIDLYQKLQVLHTITLQQQQPQQQQQSLVNFDNSEFQNSAFC